MDVVVLRNEGDSVNFLGSWDHQYKHGLQVRNRTEVVEPVLNLFVLGNSKPTADPGRRSALMELATASHLDGHDHSNNSRTADGKPIFMAPWTPYMQFAIRQLATQPFHNRQQAKVEPNETILSNHTILFTQEWLNLSVEVSQFGQETLQRTNVYRLSL